MSTQVRANCFTGSKTHLHSNLCPSSLLADHFKASLLLDQLDRDKCKGVNPHMFTAIQKYITALLNFFLKQTLALCVQALVKEKSLDI